MKFRLTRSFTTLFASLTILLSVSLDANAQGRIGQNWFNGTSRTAGNVQSIYMNNSKLPLGGLFAPDFTRTLTVLGGWNFPSSGTGEQFLREINASPDDPTGLPFSQTTELDDTGYALSFAFGRRHSNTLRSEIEVAFRSNDIDSTVDDGVTTEVFDDGSVTATSLMKNFIIDFANDTRFTPYAGAGLGISYVNVESGEETSGFPIDEGQALFSYQAIGGVATRLNSFADFIVEYRFLGTSSVEFEGFGPELSYNTSSLFMGLKFEY